MHPTRRALSAVPTQAQAAEPRPGATKRWTGFGVAMARTDIEKRLAGMKGPARPAENVSPPTRRFEIDPPATELGARQIAAQIRAATVERAEFLIDVGLVRATGRDVAIVLGVTVLLLVLR